MGRISKLVWLANPSKVRLFGKLWRVFGALR
ncbi:hypothetical protein BH160DRAFT_4490 [Burkholderia sp. H160]|nr:hypothetical protein BH160DRAFT_4490 [Burkholderia sp. H160]